MRSLILMLSLMLLSGCALGHAWIDAGACLNTSKLPSVDLANRVVNGGELVTYEATETERCLKLNAGTKLPVQ